jgi:hypothetical protein
VKLIIWAKTFCWIFKLALTYLIFWRNSSSSERSLVFKLKGNIKTLLSSCFLKTYVSGSKSWKKFLVQKNITEWVGRRECAIIRLKGSDFLQKFNFFKRLIVVMYI